MDTVQIHYTDTAVDVDYCRNPACQKLHQRIWIVEVQNTVLDTEYKDPCIELISWRTDSLVIAEIKSEIKESC